MGEDLADGRARVRPAVGVGVDAGAGKGAARVGLPWNPGRPLPVQRFVQALEHARLVFHARRELPRLTAVASQVMLVDSRLTEAEELLDRAAELLDRAARHRSSVAVARHRLRAPPATASVDGGAAGPAGLGTWSEPAVLAVVAGGRGVLASMVGRDLRLGPGALALLTLSAAAGTVVAARLAAGGLHQLGARRRLDVAVPSAALACGTTLALAVGHLATAAGRAALGLALLGLATAGSYAATPTGPGEPTPTRVCFKS